MNYTIRFFVMLFLCIGFSLPTLGAGSGSEDKQDINKVTVGHFSDNELVDILKGEGYGNVIVDRKGVIVFKSDGRSFILANKEDALKLYFMLPGVKMSLKKINDWNQTKRFSSAFLDKDGDPVLESELPAHNGLTRDGVRKFLRIFNTSKMQFFLKVIGSQ